MQGPKNYVGKCKHLKSSKRGHAGVKKLADRNGYSGRTTQRSIIVGDLNLTYADWNGHTEKSWGTQACLNRLVWKNGYTQVVNSSTRGDALLDVYFVRPESAFTSCSNVQGISDHCVVLLEVEWGEKCCEHQVERLLPVYHKTNVPGLQRYLRDRFSSWASNGTSSCVEEIWKRFKEIVYASIDPEYYNKEVKRLKAKVR